MAHLLFDVSGQKLIRKDSFFAVAKSASFLKCKFNFLTDDWDNKSATAVFVREDNDSVVKYAVLDDNNECYVPNEMLEDVGYVKVSIYTIDTTVGLSKITTNYDRFFVHESGYYVGDESIDTLDQNTYEQLISHFNEARQEVKADKEFIEEAVEKFSHIHGGTFTSDDWTGEETDDDPQNATIQNRTGLEADFDETKMRVGELTGSEEGVIRFKVSDDNVVVLSNKSDMDQIAGDLANLTTNTDLTSDELNTLVGNFSALKRSYDGEAITGAYVGDDYCLYLTNSAGTVVVGPLGPFAGTGGGGGGGGASYSKLSVTNATPGGVRSFVITESGEAAIAFDWSSIDNETGEETGEGTYKLFRSGQTLLTKSVPQGRVTIDLAPYAESGDNDFKVTVTDIDGNSRSLTFSVTKVAVSISSSFNSNQNFGGSINFTCKPIGSGIAKKVKIKIDDELVYTSQNILSSGVDHTHVISALPHGVHTLDAWVEAEVGTDGSTVSSEVLHYELLCYESSNNTTLIASSFALTSAPKYTPIEFTWHAYSSRSTTVDVTITTKTTDAEGNVSTVTSTNNVDRTPQKYSARLDTVGTVEITISSAAAVPKKFTITVTENEDIKVEPATNNMVLHLTSNSRSNSETNPGIWKYGNIDTTFSNFDWASSGWNTDDEGLVALSLVNDARAVINYNPHEVDWKGTGKTIILDFMSHTVQDYDAKIIQCYSGNRGFYVTPTKVVLQYLGGLIEAPFKENSHISVAITVDATVNSNQNYRLVSLYINGIRSAVVQYPSSAIFKQDTAVPITIGSSDSGVNVYNIRIYNRALSRREVVDTWIADTNAITTMLERYTRNNIYDENGNILISKLPSSTPYLIISTPSTLPTKKADPAVLVSGFFVWPEHPEKSFAFYDAELTVQGTSSEAYIVKNWKLKFATGFYMLESKETVSKFKMRDNSVGINKPCLKADYASDENANNVVLTRSYNDLTPYRTPHQQVQDYLAEADPTYQPLDIRQGIDGFGMLMFRATNDDLRTEVRKYSYTLDDIKAIDATCMGQYNFNNDKGNEDVFGFIDGDESWEWLINSGGIVNMLDGIMDDWEADAVDENGDPILDKKGNPVKVWQTQIEARYPEDNEDYSNIKGAIDFIKSTDVVTPLKSDEEKEELKITSTYLTPEQKATLDSMEDGAEKTALDQQYRSNFVTERLTKFKEHLGDWIELTAFAFTFVFHEWGLMIDNWSKNSFWTKMHDTVNGEEVQSKWFDLPYDFDSALGIDNNGNLVYDYFLEGTDHLVTIPKSALDPNKTYDIINETSVDGVAKVTLVEWADDPLTGVESRKMIYNGQENTLYVNWQKTPEFMERSAEIYRGLRSSGKLTYEKMRDTFTEHQKAWSESMYNEDGEIKYLSILYANGDVAQLPKLLGSKASQRDYFMYYRTLYLDSKYIAGTGADYIELRTYAPSEGLTLTPHITSYVCAEWGNNKVRVQKRTHAGESATLQSTLTGAGENDNVLYIYCAQMLEDPGDLSKNMLGYINVGNAYNITRIKAGDSNPSYVNPYLERLTLNSIDSGATYPMCKVIDARNCVNLGSGINNTPQVIDLRSCVNLEEAYFDGTSIKSLDLPNTGTLRVVHYSSSTNAVIIRNQPNITDLVVPDWDMIDVVILENVGSVVDLKNLYSRLKNKASVRLSGFSWTASSVTEIDNWLNAIDAKEFDWLDENGNSTRIEGQTYEGQEKSLICTINIDEISGSDVTRIREKWIGVTIVANTLNATVTFMNGDVPMDTAEVDENGEAVYTGTTPTKETDDMYVYTFAGWALTPDATEPYSDALKNITQDITVYAVFSKEYKNVTVTYYNDTTVLDTQTLDYGGHPSYDGPAPVNVTGTPFKGWSSDGGETIITTEDLSTLTITADTDFYAMFNEAISIKFYNGTRLLQENSITEGESGVVCTLRPSSSTGGAFLGWSSDGGVTIYTAEELPQLVFTKNTNFYAKFEATYTVRFFKYQGDATPQYTANNVPKNGTANFVGTLPTGDHGEEFRSWNPSNVGIVADTDCVAVFEPTYTVTYYVGNEVFYTDEYIKYGAESTCPNTPNVSGKVFKNWDKDTSIVTGNMSVFAVFENSYTVTFFGDTEGVNVAYVDEVESGETAVFEGTYPTGPYNAPFVSWDQPLTNITSNRYIYPIFEDRYTATFYNENGSQTYQIQNGIAPNGHATYSETEPTKTGHVFIGWTYDGGTHILTTAQLDTYAINADTAFYAQFKKLNTVNFYNGSETYSTVNNVQSGSTVNNPSGTPVDTERAGTFLGWALGSINGTVYTDVSEVTINADTNFYAKYSTAYIVYFYSDDTTLWDTVKGVAPGGSATTSKGNPSKEGYKFVNWDPIPENITNDLRTYANWEKVHTVTFVDGSTVYQTNNNVDNNTYVSYTATTPTKTGYRFTGWDKDPATTPIMADTVFNAQWIQLHTVRFMVEGVANETKTIDHGGYATYTGATPTKDGFTFTGWDKDPANTPINADTDFVAQFSENTSTPAAWEALFAAIDAGAVANSYNVGDEISYTNKDNETFTAVIAAIGSDTVHDVDANDNAIPVSIIVKELQTTTQKMNDTNDNTTGWSGSKMRVTTMAELKAKLPDYITERLVAAKKYSLKQDNTEEVTYDELWIPSQQEVGLGYETSGIVYSGLFTDAASRIKQRNGSNSYYWTRTANAGNAAGFRYVDSYGNSGSNVAGNARGVALGFCLGKISEEKAWTKLGNEIVNSVYTGSLQVGDTLPFTTTDGETFNAQIVGFGTDVDENGKAIPVSFIVKELQTTSEKMNDTNDNTTGWSGSKMRTTTMPALKAKLPNYIKDHLVAAKKYSLKQDSTTEETYDELWIPSQREVGLTGYETAGPSYTGVFTGSTARKKFKLNASSADYYWTRTAAAGNATDFRFVNVDGYSNNGSASGARGVALGFCWE